MLIAINELKRGITGLGSVNMTPNTYTVRDSTYTVRNLV